VVRVPLELQERALLVERTADELFRELGRRPTLAQIAERTELSIEHTWSKHASPPEPTTAYR